MAVFRVERNKGYTVMSNHHLRNKELSLKQEDSTLNRQFEDFAGFYGFKPILCRPYRGQTKGTVARTV